MQKVRSRAYPSLNLESAINKLDRFAHNLGKGVYSREAAVIGMGYRGLSGASARAVAALVQYGLLDRQKDSYSISPLGREAVYPADSNARRVAIRQALLRPALFADLVEQYNGQELPEQRFLANVLTMPKYGINPKQKDEVAEIFVDSLRFAGFMNGDRLEVEGADGDIKDSQYEQEDLRNAQPVVGRSSSSADPQMNRIEIVLQDGGRATITAPPNLTEEDRQRLKKAIELL